MIKNNTKEPDLRAKALDKDLTPLENLTIKLMDI